VLEKEFKYYLAHQAELVKKHKGKYLVIKDEQVIGVYDSQSEAYNTTQKEHEVGTFLIQYCDSGNDSYTQTYHSRVTFRRAYAE
jgi:hypothetical protein